MNRVTLVVTTYNRLWALERFVASVKKHTQHPYQILVVVDGGDLEAYQWAVRNGLKAALISYQRECVGQTNLGAFLADTELFGYFNDDMLATQDGWLASAVQMFQADFPDGVGLLSFDDGIQPNGRIAVCGLTSRAFIRAAYGGTLFYLGYQHFCGDRELTIVAQQMGRYRVSGIPFLHAHHSTGLSQSDDVYEESNKHWASDTALFEARQREGFPR